MRNIAVFTGTRAEYGLLYWLMKEIQASHNSRLQVIVSGMHLSPEFGDTWRTVQSDGFDIDAKVEMLISSDTPVGVAKSMGVGTIGFADALDRLKPSMLVVLGDRFEALAVAQTALIMQIPIAHIHGGELTEGAYDDSIRHCLTKMATLHFVATAAYKKRVVQMGEHPDRVYNVGAVGLDHIERTPMDSIVGLSESLEFELDSRFIVVTYHPVTSAEENPESTFSSLLAVLDRYSDYQVIITYPNADNGGRALIPVIERYAASQPTRVLAIPSLGFRRYMGAMRHAALIIGNSSSGIIEAPSFGVPTVNIGDRQKGRLAASSVIHCAADEESIAAAVEVALSESFAEVCALTTNPYGRGDAAKQILSVLESYAHYPRKTFYDLQSHEIV